jgi:O-acetylhomoserine (thiol)-lyase
LPTHGGRRAAAITPKTKAVYSETLGNPDLLTLDIRAVADVAHDAGVPLIIDNTMPSPYLCRPLEHGADIVVESLTKFIGGHGTSIGGIIVDGGSFDWTNGKFPGSPSPTRATTGWSTAMSSRRPTSAPTSPTSSRPASRGCATPAPRSRPFNSFLFLQGVETLPLRMERHSQNAMAIARFLTEHPR